MDFIYVVIALGALAALVIVAFWLAGRTPKSQREDWDKMLKLSQEVRANSRKQSKEWEEMKNGLN
jgi:hypothetical protein